jgi:hypothetical protein
MDMVIKKTGNVCKYKLNMEGLSCNNWCCGNLICITYSECVFVVLIIHHAMGMRRIALLIVACLVLPHFFTLSRKRHDFRKTFIHLVVCLTTGPKPLPKRALHIVRSRASSFKWEYPLLSLRSSSSFLRLHPCLPVTFIRPCIFPSVTRCRRQFLRKMWPIQFAFRLRISCNIFLCSLTLSNTSSFLTWSVLLILFHPSPAPHFKTFQVFLIYCTKRSIFSTI